MRKLIKIYGERHTNTNYLSKLIELNLDVHQLPGTIPSFVRIIQEKMPGNELFRNMHFYFTYASNLGWKHSLVKSPYILNKQKVVINNDMSFLSITKNPYSWLLSLHRRPYHHYYPVKLNFEEFLEHPWKPVNRDNLENCLKNPIELWNVKNASYSQLLELNGLNITTESTFENPESVINKISNHFSITKKSETFINYERSTKTKSKDGDWYRDYYLNERWRKEITDNEIAIINKHIDKKLMAKFGYTLLSPSNNTTP